MLSFQCYKSIKLIFYLCYHDNITMVAMSCRVVCTVMWPDMLIHTKTNMLMLVYLRTPVGGAVPLLIMICAYWLCTSKVISQNLDLHAVG